MQNQVIRMKYRKYKWSSILELEEIVCRAVKQMRHVRHELQSRKTRRAIALKEKMEKILPKEASKKGASKTH